MLGMILAQAAEAVMSLGLDKMGACLGAAIAAIAAGIGIGKIGARYGGNCPSAGVGKRHS